MDQIKWVVVALIVSGIAVLVFSLTSWTPARAGGVYFKDGPKIGMTIGVILLALGILVNKFWEPK